MRLTDLDPRWTGTPPGIKTGMNFICPCCKMRRIAVTFQNTIGGGQKLTPGGWMRRGETFDTITLYSSIDIYNHWHGHVTDGEVTTVSCKCVS
jgi:hypothetical protein